MKEYYTPKELAKLLDITNASMYAWIRAGKVKASKTLGKRYRISQEEADRIKAEMDKTN